MPYQKTPLHNQVSQVSDIPMTSDSVRDEYSQYKTPDSIPKKIRQTAVNIDTRHRDLKLYPNVNYVELNFPKTFSNVSEIEISSLELPNSVSVFSDRNNKIRWINQYGWGHINAVSVSTNDPVANAVPGGTRTDKFVKITVDGTARLNVVAGDIVKIVALYTNAGTAGSGVYRPETHKIGNDSRHFTSGNSHTGKLLSVSGTSMSILPNHYFSTGSSYSTWRKWGSSTHASGEVASYYVGWKMCLTSGNGKGSMRRVSAYSQTDRTITVESAWDSGKEPSADDTYHLLKDAYMVYVGPGDTVSTGVIATGKVPHNVFYIIDYETGTNATLPAGDYNSSVGMWYNDCDEYANYSGQGENIIYRVSIGNQVRLFQDSSNKFSKILTESFSSIKYGNGDNPNFNVEINDNSEMFSIQQNHAYNTQRWGLHWEYDASNPSGPFMTVRGCSKFSAVLPAHGFIYGNIIGIVRYPPSDAYNKWSSTDASNGWPVSDLSDKIYGCAMIITDSDVSLWGEKNKFQVDMEIEIKETYNSNVDGIHRIVHVPRTGYRINSGESAPCFCFVIPVYLDSEIPSTYPTLGSSSILSTGIYGSYGSRVEVKGSTGVSGTSIALINKTHTVIGSGGVLSATSGMGYRIETDDQLDRDAFIMQIAANGFGGTGTITSGGFPTSFSTSVPMKIKLKGYIDDLGPSLGLTGTERKDTDKFMRSISNSNDGTKNTSVKNPVNITGDNYFYMSINNISDKGYSDTVSPIHDSNYSGHILNKILVVGGSGEVMFNTYMGGNNGGKNPIMKFDPPIRSLDKIAISLYRKLGRFDLQSDLEKYLKKVQPINITIDVNIIPNKMISEVSDGIKDTIINLKSKKDGIAHLLLGKGNSRIGTQNWQFSSESIEKNSGSYRVLLKILPQRIIDFDRDSTIDVPIDPIDIANYISENIPVSSSTHDELVYIKNITQIVKLLEIPLPPKGFDFLNINNVDYSMTLSLIENI